MQKSIPDYYLYGENEPANTLDFMHVESIAERSSLHEWEIEPHRHKDLSQLLYLKQGFIDAQLDDQRLTLKDHTLAWIPATSVHGFRANSHANGLVLTLSDSLLQQSLPSPENLDFSNYFRQPFVHKLTATTELHQDIEQLVNRIVVEFQRSQPGRQQAVAANLRLLMIILARNIAPSALNKKRSQDQQIMNAFMAVVETQYKNNWAVSQYAESLGLSENRLSDLCKQLTGLTPLQMVHKRIFTEAKRNLAYTSLPISVIAYELGFKDPAYFSRFFSRLSGTSARQFRDRASS